MASGDQPTDRQPTTTIRTCRSANPACSDCVCTIVNISMQISWDVSDIPIPEITNRTQTDDQDDDDDGDENAMWMEMDCLDLTRTVISIQYLP